MLWKSHGLVKLFSLTLLICLFNGCSKDTRLQSRVAAPQTADYDHAISTFVAILPKLKLAVSSIDPDKLQGNLKSFKGLSEDKEGTLESLQIVERDSREVLSEHKFYDELQLTHDTAILDSELSLLHSDLAEFVDRSSVNRFHGFTWLAALAGSEGTMTTFETDSYAYLLTRARAVDSTP